MNKLAVSGIVSLSFGAGLLLSGALKHGFGEHSGAHEELEASLLAQQAEEMCIAPVQGTTPLLAKATSSDNWYEHTDRNGYSDHYAELVASLKAEAETSAPYFAAETPDDVIALLSAQSPTEIFYDADAQVIVAKWKGEESAQNITIFHDSERSVREEGVQSISTAPLNRVDGPARIKIDLGKQSYFHMYAQDGVLGRDASAGPSVLSVKDGAEISVQYQKDNELHNENGFAYVTYDLQQEQMTAEGFLNGIYAIIDGQPTTVDVDIANKIALEEVWAEGELSLDTRRMHLPDSTHWIKRDLAAGTIETLKRYHHMDLESDEYTHAVLRNLSDDAFISEEVMVNGDVIPGLPEGFDPADYEHHDHGGMVGHGMHNGHSDGHSGHGGHGAMSSEHKNTPHHSM